MTDDRNLMGGEGGSGERKFFAKPKTRQLCAD
jgi:hypothetical protein